MHALVDTPGPPSANGAANLPAPAASSMDALTGLPRLDYLELRVAEALRGSRRRRMEVAIVALGLDRAVGSATGAAPADDAVRLAFVARVGQTLRPDDPLVVLDGGALCVLCEGVSGRDEALGVAGRVAEALAAPLVVGGEPVPASASIGVALPPPLYPRATDLIADAVAALGRAVAAGGARVEVSDPRPPVRRGAPPLHEALRTAIPRGQLDLVYQPLVRLADERVVGLEALLRFSHPELGRVPAARCVGAAVAHGLAVPIGAWVLERGCGQASRWAEAGLATALGALTVNLSAAELAEPGVVAAIVRILERTGLTPDRLILDVTAAALTQPEAPSPRALDALRALGVRLACDDLTAADELGGAARGCVDMLKLDRSIVAALGTPAADEAAAGVARLATELAVPALAEGVETEAQLAAVRELGYVFAQGFLLGRPLPGRSATDLLRGRLRTS